MSITEKAHAPANLIKALEVAGVEETGTITTKQAVDVLMLMGLPVLLPKPEPGTWHTVGKGGWPAFVDDSGSLLIFESDGEVVRKRREDPWPDLIPARVVPAEPSVLTMEEVGELYSSARAVEVSMGVMGWDYFGSIGREVITRTVNAALAKHGGARELPGRDEVRDAVASGKGNGWGLTDEPINAITDAVMDLLGGGGRGE